MAKAKRKLSPYNRHVQREMKRGKSMKQAAASWRSGKRSTPKRKSISRKSPAKKGGKRTVARKGGFNQQKVFKIVRLAALALPAVSRAMQAGVSNEGKLRNILKAYTGFDNSTMKFNWADLAEGYAPLLGATVATYGIPKLVGLLRSF